MHIKTSFRIQLEILINISQAVYITLPTQYFHIFAEFTSKYLNMKTSSYILGFLAMGLTLASPLTLNIDKHQIRGAKRDRDEVIAKREPVDADENLGNMWCGNCVSNSDESAV
ncbi:uncharacterized protein F4822DRAFT_406964 [Hypoxylon trugodes]|uniref:uncharacterized protein n=1 Tax=Hypoxylon trugodes TaxID=326681 RepID=UPI00218EFCBA|nr:uncharacterized protein F4822DRAFT_406964 [Hypoxylon trugodes]KAI1387572.1 hypothetical protein F4822DRAFT_406964 [Hypoxylon trugodes]